MKVCIIRYNAGNTESVKNALIRIGADPLVSNDPETIRTADKVIFPGVGEASTAMSHLRDRKLDDLIRDLEQPVLGICLGMQLLCTSSEENEATLLGLIDTPVVRFNDREQRVPHVGWNRLQNLRTPLFQGVDDEEYVYFVHSFYVPLVDETTATSNYGESFSAAIAHKNYYGVQFHTEKSGTVGEKILENFLAI